MIESEQETSGREDFDVANRRFPVGKLSVMNRLAELGVGGAADRLGQLADDDAVVETDLAQAGYVTEDTLAHQFETSQRTGARVNVREVPGGYVLVTFPLWAANNAAALMLSDTVDDVSEVDAEMARSALTELSGIMANGFFDVWANRFGEEIVLSEPSPVHDAEREIVGQTVSGSDALGLYLTSRIRIPEVGVSTQLFLFPETETFLQLAERVTPGMLD
ncbi:MAG: hypothetical protein ABEJ30_01345 [Halorientalis sp.]